MREKKNQERDILRMDEKKSYFRFFGVWIILLFTFTIHSCTKDEGNILPEADPLKAVGITNIFPANLADSVVVNPMITVTFKEGTIPSEISASNITVKQGANTIPGILTFTDKTAVFTSEDDLNPEKEYIATIKTSVKGSTTTSKTSEYSWKFKTGKHHGDNTLAVASVVPLNTATAVSVTFQPTITFNGELTPSMISSVAYDLYQGTTHVDGSLSFSGKNATFKPTISFTANTRYTGKIKIHTRWNDDHQSDHTYTWSFTTANAGTDVTAPVISSVVPANSATAVPVSSYLTAVFSEPMNPLTINTTTFSLKQNTTVVPGTITYSGNTAIFTPSSSFAPNLTYSATISTGVKDVSGNALASNYIWSFTTTAATTDVTAPTVLSVQPANGATTVSTSVKPAVTFSETMDASTISTSSFTLKQGVTNVIGTVTYSGTTATFTPTSILANSTTYTLTITTAAKDIAGNAIVSNYVSGFTTAAIADVTPPSVLTVVPANGATSIAVNSKITATFNEAMNTSTITSASFTLKQGTTSVAGAVTYSGTTATFTPTGDLTGNLVYTASITTAVKDIAGNALTSNYTWSFTTIATTPPVTGLSFATDVVPALNVCNACHTHNWTTSAVASTFYTNLVSSGYVNVASYTTSKLYTKMNAGHPSSSMSADMTKIVTWMSQGSKNN